MSVMHRYQPNIRHAAIPAREPALAMPLGRIGQINIALLLVACAALVLYVVQANRAGAVTWRTEDANARLESVKTERDALVSQYAALEDRDALAALAAAAGMQMDGAIAHLVDRQPVAVR